MSASGSFEVQLTPEDDGEAPAGRMRIQKTYTGDLVGSGAGQMISKRTDAGAAVYYAIEEVSGALHGKTGGFTLLHEGRMDPTMQSLRVTILAGSGRGELSEIAGSMRIEQDETGHRYTLELGG